MRERPTYVYMIGHERKDGMLGGPVKIGVSDDPAKRLKQMQTSSPQKLAILAVIAMPMRKAAFMLEAVLHAYFADKRMQGEWFDVCAFEAGGALAALTREALVALGGKGDDLARVLEWSGATDLMCRWVEENDRRAH